MPRDETSNSKTRRPGTQSVRSELSRITESPDFDTSQRTVGFLQFVVEKKLAGHENAISQNAIASSVFGRDDRFDPTTDPIVRMQASRVRRSLEHYYLTTGADDPVLIELPKGSYVPVLSFREPTPEVPHPFAKRGVIDTNSWPTLLVTPLHNLTGRQDAEYIAKGLASDLAAEISRDKSIHVFLSPLADVEPNTTSHVRFEISGTLALRGENFKINLHLVDNDTGRQVWAHTFDCPKGSGLSTVLDMAVQSTAAMVAEERGLLARHLDEEARKNPCSGNSYEAILRHHHFALTSNPQTFTEALSALRQAVETTPRCALCWTYLARLGGVHWSFGGPGEVIPIEDSIAAARRGAGLAPLDVRSRSVLAYVLLLADEVDQARAEADAALQLSGMSAFWLDAVGYLLTLSGDWEKGPELIQRAIQINPFPRRSCYAALWLDALRREDSAALLATAREYAPENNFWSPLMEAVALVVNDRVTEAVTPIERLLQLKPDFSEHAHWLIKRYVKFDDLAHHIEDALELAGLSIASV